MALPWEGPQPEPLVYLPRSGIFRSTEYNSMREQNTNVSRLFELVAGGPIARAIRNKNGCLTDFDVHMTTDPLTQISRTTYVLARL